MSLSFPNPSRSYDATKNRVRFWGYDSAIEISFVVEEGALEKLCPDMSHTEGGLLVAFDDARTRIHEVADRVYARSTKRTFSFCLAASDL